MTRTRRPRPFVVVALLSAAYLTAGSVLGHSPDPVLGSTFWPKDTTLTFRWRAGELPPAALQTAIRAAAADSNATKASRAASYVYASNGSNPIEYGLDVTCGVNGIACFTRSVPDGFTMGFREQGHRFDWGSLKWCQMFTTPWPNGCFDVETIALDEFGHVQGLDHHVNHSDASDYSDAVVQTVSRTKPSTGWNMHRYGRCDVATLQTRYDVPAATSGISTCLDLASSLSLTASRTWVVHGGSVTFTAALKIGSSTGYGQLAGNALSSRTVVLQRRVLTASAWTTVATMAPGTSAGTYVTSFVPSTAYEWRASFAKPSAEGLRGSTSSGVIVDVIIPCQYLAVAVAMPCE